MDAWAPHGVHDTAIALIASKSSHGTVLDIGAGTGVLSDRLFNAGFKVTSCDLEPQNFKPKHIKCHKVDINEGLPFEDDFFDYVVCLEVLEHVENIHRVINQTARIMKTGGTAIFSTPNTCHIQSKIFYLLTGQLGAFRSESYDLGHINPVYLHFLPKIFAKNNLTIELQTYNRGYLYTSLLKGSCLGEHGITLPWKNQLFGQVVMFSVKKDK